MWYLQESNQGHMDFQSIALPTELRYRSNAGANIEWFLIYTKQLVKKSVVFLQFKFITMLLVIDVGNTRIKSAVFEQDKQLGHFVFLKEDLLEKVDFILKQHPKVGTIVVASVGSLEQSDFLAFKSKVKVVFITREFDFPFVNLYESPTTLGIDRMVLASGAVLQFPKQNRLIIDAGTCITYDFVDETDNYLGGAISPGIRLRYESLHNYTAKLPLLEREFPKSSIGKSTSESIHSGVINSVIFEIDGYIDYFKSENANFIIILTGGDADFLAMQLKNTIFANSNFLLESLNQTFQYNQKWLKKL